MACVVSVPGTTQQVTRTHEMKNGISSGSSGAHEPLLGVLLPLTHRAIKDGTANDKLGSIAAAVRGVLDGCDCAPVAVVFGVDEDDPVLSSSVARDALTRAAIESGCKAVVCHVFPKAAAGAAVSRALSAARQGQSIDLARQEQTEAPPSPLCWMWGELAAVAVRQLGASCFVLLGDDVRPTPSNWAQLVLNEFDQHFRLPPGPHNDGPACPSGHDSPAPSAGQDGSAPSAGHGGCASPSDQDDGSVSPAGDDDGSVPPAAAPPAVEAAAAAAVSYLGCLLLTDEADPGFPSFPVIGAAHLEALPALLPALFLNQEGDPFLWELYRRVGRWRACEDVRIVNQRGGLELADNPDYRRPLYQRVYAPRDLVLSELEVWGNTLRQYYAARHQALPSNPGAGVTTVDVLVPCGRADIETLTPLLETVLLRVHPEADVVVAVVVDAVPCVPEARWDIQQLKARMPAARMRLRFNTRNMGASGTRNKLMEEAFAELLVFLDDDVAPAPGCVDAYVRAARLHPNAKGFMGPTLLPLPPAAPRADWPWIKRVLAVGVHVAGVAFFWGAPAHIDTTHLAWGVTANMALRNTAERFNLCFPRTGGGEDVDLCLRATGVARPDPEARLGAALQGHQHQRDPAQGAPGGSAEVGMRLVRDAVCVHPWWGGGGHLITNRFFLWSVGDGELLHMYPHLTYRAWPNGHEIFWLLLIFVLPPVLLLATSASALRIVLATAAPASQSVLTTMGADVIELCSLWATHAARVLVLCCVSLFATEMAADMVTERFLESRLRRHPCPERNVWLASCVYSTVIRCVQPAGRLCGHYQRRGLLRACQITTGCRFDWFGGLIPSVWRAEVRSSGVRFVFNVLALTATVYACWVANSQGPKVN